MLYVIQDRQTGLYVGEDACLCSLENAIFHKTIKEAKRKHGFDIMIEIILSVEINIIEEVVA